MQRNRESAARSRIRKREYVEELQTNIQILSKQVSDHDTETALFNERINRLEAENFQLRQQLERYKNFHSTTLETTPIPQPLPIYYPELSSSSKSTSTSTPNSPLYSSSDDDDEQTNLITPTRLQESPEQKVADVSEFNKYATLDDSFSLQLEETSTLFWPILFGLILNLLMLHGCPSQMVPAWKQTTPFKTMICFHLIMMSCLSFLLHNRNTTMTTTTIKEDSFRIPSRMELMPSLPQRTENPLEQHFTLPP